MDAPIITKAAIFILSRVFKSMKIALNPILPPAIKFSADIRLVVRKEFAQILQDQNLEKSGSFYTDDNAYVTDQIRAQPKGWTPDAYRCSILTLLNPEKTSVFHLFPNHFSTTQALEKLKTAIEEDARTLFKSEDGTKFICGGIAYDYVKKESKRLFKQVQTFLQQARAPFCQQSILWGRKHFKVDGGTSIISLPKTREIIVNAKQWEGDKDVETLKDVQETFKHIKIAPRDRLITKGKTIVGSFKKSN